MPVKGFDDVTARELKRLLGEDVFKELNLIDRNYTEAEMRKVLSACPTDILSKVMFVDMVTSKEIDKVADLPNLGLSDVDGVRHDFLVKYARLPEASGYNVLSRTGLYSHVAAVLVSRLLTKNSIHLHEKELDYATEVGAVVRALPPRMQLDVSVTLPKLHCSFENGVRLYVEIIARTSAPKVDISIGKCKRTYTLLSPSGGDILSEYLTPGSPIFSDVGERIASLIETSLGCDIPITVSTPE